MKKCRNHNSHCLLYAVDNEVVFNEAEWAGILGPYKTAEEAQAAATGIELGQRFPNVAFKGADGGSLSISAFKGKIVLLQFWGSWCPACVIEMPFLQKLFDAVGGEDRIAFVFLQAREPFNTSKLFLEQKGLTLPAYDTGVVDRADSRMKLGNGEEVKDVELSPRFPTTYVLDKNGIVLFRHTGTSKKWLFMEPILRDAMARAPG